MTGLLVYGRTPLDNTYIGELIDNEDFEFHGEWNVRDGYWFFEEEIENVDTLEAQLSEIFRREGINAKFEVLDNDDNEDVLETNDYSKDAQKEWWDENQNDLISAITKMIPDQRVSVLTDAGMSHEDAELECEGTPRHIAMTLWSIADIASLEEICATFASPVDEKKVMNFKRFVESQKISESKSSEEGTLRQWKGKWVVDYSIYDEHGEPIGDYKGDTGLELDPSQVKDILKYSKTIKKNRGIDVNFIKVNGKAKLISTNL